MEKMFTKVFGSVLMVSLLAGAVANAQSTTASNSPAVYANADSKIDKKADAAVTADAKTEKKDDPADSTWKPQRRLWGYTFGDFYYEGHADKGGRGGETNYSGVPTGRNAFQFRRLYLGYDYDITKKFKAEVLLASEPNANTNPIGTSGVQGGDNLADNRMGFYIKNFNLRVRDLWTGTDLVIGEMSTPGFALNEPGTNAPTSLAEATWSYRSIERTITDFHKNNSYDVGAALQGTFDTKTKNFGYVFMVGNNSTSSLLSAANANTGFYKIFYGDLWGKFFKQKLYVDFYADYAKTGPSSVSSGAQEHNMFKLFAAYTTPIVTIGAEAYTQKLTNGVTNTTTKAQEDATVQGLSVWIRGGIVKNKLGYFARFDTYNPDTDYSSSDSYTVNTNYGSYTPVAKEQFYTAGLDYTPAKNIHFMPNIWLTEFKDQRDATAAGYLPADHIIVYRMTFFFTFGK